MSDPKIQQNVDWRSIYPVHPCADVFPMMSDADLDALAQDIKANGLRDKIVLYEDDHKTRYVLDGRNRLAALSRLGLEVKPPDTRVLNANVYVNKHPHPWLPDQLAAYVISRNIHRRHLTKEQQAELIVKTIEAGKSSATDRATVARSVTRGRNGRVQGSTKDPVLEAAVTEAAKHNISKRTVQKARAKLQGKPKAPRVTKADLEAQRVQTQRVKDDLAAQRRGFVETIDESPVYEWARLELLGKNAGPARVLALRVIDVGYKAVAHEVHPDKGGSVDEMARLNAVRDHLKHCV